MSISDPLPEIVQIIPASGYLALYRAKDGTVFGSPVVLWAIVRHMDGRDMHNEVEGLESGGEEGIVRCQESENWIAYTEAATFNPEEWTPATRATP